MYKTLCYAQRKMNTVLFLKTFKIQWGQRKGTFIYKYNIMQKYNNRLAQVKNYGRGERVPSAGELLRAIKKERLLPQSHLFPNPQFRIQNSEWFLFVMLRICYLEREHQGLCSKVRSRDMGLHCKTKYLGNTFFWKGKNTFHS